MASNTDSLAGIIREIIIDELKRQLGNVHSPYIYATFAAAEGVDANLSRLTLPGGETARFVPKGAHVTGLVAGNTVLCVKGKGVPLSIIAKMVGDITLASI